jgi:hypothetical protein
MAPAFILASTFALASGDALAQTGGAGNGSDLQPSPPGPPASGLQSPKDSSDSASRSPTTRLSPGSETFIQRYDARAQACIQRCVSAAPSTSGATANGDGSTWTLEQFASQFDPSVQSCISQCGISQTALATPPDPNGAANALLTS